MHILFPKAGTKAERFCHKIGQYNIVFIYNVLKYKFIYFNCRLITLQYCIGFAIHQIGSFILNQTYIELDMRSTYRPQLFNITFLFFSFFFYFLNYDVIITHLQETQKYRMKLYIVLLYITLIFQQINSYFQLKFQYQTLKN